MRNHYRQKFELKAPFGWAKRDGSFRTEVPDNPIGWTPLYAWTAFPWSDCAELMAAGHRFEAKAEGGDA